MSRARKIFPEARSLLVVRAGAIGDVTNALAFANAVRDAAPDLRIGWVVHPLSRPLVEGHPSIDRTHVWERGGGWRGFRDLVRDVRAERYDLAVDLQRIQKSAVLTALAGARARLSYDRGRSKELAWIWGGSRVPAGRPEDPMLDQVMGFAEALGLPAAPRRSLPVEDAAEAFADGLVAELGGAPLLVNLGASKPANRWPAERFGRLAAHLAAGAAGPVCLVGGPDDREAAEGACAALDGADVRDLVGRTRLPELVSLLRRARLFVGCDTGPMHLAAALDVPLVALFGPADERRTGPYGWDRPERVSAPAPRVVRTRPDCAPCGAKRCPLPRRACMLDLELEPVLEACRLQLAAGRERRPNAT